MFLRLSDDDLRAPGLSAGKVRTLRAVATDIVEERLPLDRLPDLPADEAHDLLTRVKGIGPWTADVYLLFCLGHPDAFPSGDLAVQEAARLAYAWSGGRTPRPYGLGRKLASLARRCRQGALGLLPDRQGAEGAPT